MFYCLEFSPQTEYQKIQPLYQGYLKLIPHIGKIIAKDSDSYQYLSDSIVNFLKPNEIKQKMLNAGFTKVQIIPLCAGVCNIYVCTKN
ncbi:MAG: hypothetical protein EBU93_06460 [Chlamydiae bacterium]|nr:hypothetical protein [Chlamydiota bacterium]